MYEPDRYVRECIKAAGPSPFLTLVKATLDLYGAGFASKSKAAYDAWERIGSAMVALNGAPLAFNGGLTRDGVPYPAGHEPPPEMPDVMERLRFALVNAGLAPPLDLSGGDPGYRLISKTGEVMLTLETPEGIETKASFATIADAVAYLDISHTIDPVDREAGRYGIDAPHGLGDDSEAVPLAQRLGFQIFWSMGAGCWAPAGVAISGNVSGRGWHTGFDNLQAAAFAALATVEPDECPGPCVMSYGAGTRADPDRCVTCEALFERDKPHPFKPGNRT